MSTQGWSDKAARMIGFSELAAPLTKWFVDNNAASMPLDVFLAIEKAVLDEHHPLGAPRKDAE